MCKYHSWNPLVYEVKRKRKKKEEKGRKRKK